MFIDAQIKRDQRLKQPVYSLTDKPKGQTNTFSALLLVKCNSLIISTFLWWLVLITYTWTASSSAASGSIRLKIIGPTISSLSAFLFPAFHSWNIKTMLQPKLLSADWLINPQGTGFNLPSHLCRWGRAEKRHSEKQRGDDTFDSSRTEAAPSSIWWNPPQTDLIGRHRGHLHHHLHLLFQQHILQVWLSWRCSPVTCLSGSEGMGRAEPNFSSRRSYSQSKCL